MFFLLIIVSVIGYSVQGTLLAHFARKMDALSLAVYRNLSLVISMLPLLFLADTQKITQTFDYLPEMLLAGITGATSLSISLYIFRFLPVGVSDAFKSGARVIFLVLIGIFFFAESISPAQVGLIAVILISGGYLSIQNHWMPHLDKNTTKGIFLCIICSLLTAISFSLMSKVARDLDPAISGYLWEASIAFCALFLVFFRHGTTKQKLEKISWREFGKIALVSSPTLIGTGGFAYAITMGPIGIASAISTGGIFVALILSHFWYHEKIRTLQWLTIIVMAAGIVGLKLAETS